MKVPLVAKAQMRVLAEGVTDAAPPRHPCPTACMRRDSGGEPRETVDAPRVLLDAVLGHALHALLLGLQP